MKVYRKILELRVEKHGESPASRKGGSFPVMEVVRDASQHFLHYRLLFLRPLLLVLLSVAAARERESLPAEVMHHQSSDRQYAD